MREPREVTAPDGSTRWVAADGRTFDTEDEAREASGLDSEPRWDSGFVALEEVGADPPKAARSRLREFIISAAMLVGGGWMFVFIFNELLYGDAFAESDWAWLYMPFGLFAVAGLAVTGAVGVYGSIANRQIDLDAVWEWWLGKVGCGILWVIGGILAFVIGWSALSSAFEGVSKGTGMIIVLLFFILLALTQIASNRR